MKCYICNVEKDSFGKLSKHIRDTHKDIKIKKYYDTYLKKEGEGMCIGCGNVTNFVNINVGYHKMCSSRKCACTYNRAKLKKDPIKFETFRNNVSNNMKHLWENIPEKDKIIRIKNATFKQKEWLNTLTKEERSIKFSWLNQLPPQEREIQVKRLLTNSLSKWWKEASIEDKKKTREKMHQTMIKNGNCISQDEVDAFQWYIIQVRNLTEKNYRIYKYFINPNGLKRGRSIHLDHKVSIFNGFIFNLPIQLISSPFNLELLDSTKNLSKHINNSISIEELCDLHSKMESLHQPTLKNI